MRTGHGRLAMLGVAIVGYAIAAVVATPCSAQFWQLTKDGFTVSAGMKAGVGAIATGNTNFGAGFLESDGTINHNVDYAEGYAQPRVDVSYDTGSIGTFYGAASGVAGGTLGGDPGGFTRDSPTAITADEAYAGWKSGNLLSGLGENAIDVVGGRAKYQVGSGFIMWDGFLDEGNDALYWLAPRFAFEQAGIVRLNTTPVSGQAFYLKANNFQDNSHLAGANIDYTPKDWGPLGLMYFQIFDSDDSGTFVRDGMNVINPRVFKIPVPFVPNLTITGEDAYEFGHDSKRDLDISANGWYVQLDYGVGNWLPGSPTLSYRYSKFSGEENPSNPGNSSNAFDPLFYYGPGTWGTWFQGEITGEYLLFNSNEIAHMVQLNFSPTPAITTGILFFDISLDKNNYFGTPVSSTHFDDEVNLYFNWNITDHIYLGVVGALAWPGTAAKEAFGSSKTYELLESQLVITY
jgi:hypothetical protein